MMLRRVSALAPSMALALSLAACSADKSPDAAEGADAQGEILGGTISDSMLPLDQLKSESPPMKPAPEKSGSADAAEEDPGSEGEPASEPSGEEPAEPAEEPAGEG